MHKKNNLKLVKQICNISSTKEKNVKKIIKKICPKIIYKYYKRFKNLEMEVSCLRSRICLLEKTNATKNNLSNVSNYDTIVLCPFSLISSGYYGGSTRTNGIYLEYSKFHKIKFISPYFGKQIIKTPINENLVDIKIPLSIVSEKKYEEIGRKTKMYYSGPLYLYPEAIDNSFINTVVEEIENAKYVFFELPYLFLIFKKYCKNKIVYYGSHNIELTMARELMKLETGLDSKYCEDLLTRLENCEKDCCKNSNIIGAITSLDALYYISKYGVKESNIIELPGGIISGNIKFCDITQRSINKNNAGLLNCKIGIFLGSNWGPNVEAVQNVVKIAKQTKNIIYIIMGSVCDSFVSQKLPRNILLAFQVSNELKDRIFGIADFAINLVDSGSGINTKLFDYMASGVPIISNEFGMRGISEPISVIVNYNNVIDIINNFDYSKCYELISKAYDSVRQKYDFSIIAEKIDKRIKQC